MMDENRAGVLVEYGKTKDIFLNPRDRRTEDYISALSAERNVHSHSIPGVHS
jgi:ABC-type phosphate transport system ATPase subunit